MSVAKPDKQTAIRYAEMMGRYLGDTLMNGDDVYFKAQKFAIRVGREPMNEHMYFDILFYYPSGQTYLSREETKVYRTLVSRIKKYFPVIINEGWLSGRLDYESRIEHQMNQYCFCFMAHYDYDYKQYYYSIKL